MKELIDRIWPNNDEKRLVALLIISVAATIGTAIITINIVNAITPCQL